MRKILSTSLVATALLAPALVGIAPASAAPGGCVASDPADVTVNSKADTVAITDDSSTGGNNYSVKN